MSDRLELEQTRPTGHGRARGLVSSRQSGSRIDATTFAAPEPLDDVVAALWRGRWDLSGQPAHETEILGDPCVHIVFESGDRRERRLVGVWSRRWVRRLEGRGRVRGVKVRAGGLKAFVDRPARDVADKILPLEELFGDLGPWAEEVLDVEDDPLAFARITTWLQELRRDEDVSLPIAIVDRITRDTSILTVERLAEVAGLGPRALQRLFREHVGVSPKWVIRRHRLQEAALRLEQGTVSLAELAAELGYSDQAHLTRDFRAAVGKSPRKFSRDVHD